MQLSKSALCSLASDITSRSPSLSRKINRRRFKANFGVDEETTQFLWQLLAADNDMPRGLCPSHLLWTLIFLNLYACETVTAQMCGCDEKTLRKWVWICIELLANLNLVGLRLKKSSTDFLKFPTKYDVYVFLQIEWDN